MLKILAPAAIAAGLLAACSWAAPKGKWVEVRSPNFIVVSNAGEGQARKTAADFEQVRALFRDSLPYTKGLSSPVITILAVKDEDSLRLLLPEYWANKNQAHPGGIFTNRFHQFQVAVNLSANGDNPYRGIYHEYYHSVTMPYFPGLPTWVSEGLADFYGNSQISDKTAKLGMPSGNMLEELRRNKLIPLDVLLKVDHSSPYYHEQDKVSIFYAESWALTHYLMLGDNRAHSQAFGTYLSALSGGAGQEEAAAKAFGDLRKLQDNLDRYIASSAFFVLNVPAPAKMSEGDLHIRPLSDADVDAYCGGFLALHDQFKEAEALLNEAVQLDPKLALAQRNMALLHYGRHETSDALASLSAAIAVDPKDETTRFLRAELTFGVSSRNTQIEDDLRQALASKPDFAAAQGLLGLYLSGNSEKLPEALALEQKALALEPGNTNFQMAFAQVLSRMQRYDEAEAWARRVQVSAVESSTRTQATQFLSFINQRRDYDARMRQIQDANAGAPASVARSGDAPAELGQEAGADSGQPVLRRRIVGPGPNAQGVVTDVRCDGDEMQITLRIETGPTPLLFHAKDRNAVGYTSDTPAIRSDIEPCSELKGHTTKIIFTPSENKTINGELVHIEVTK